MTPTDTNKPWTAEPVAWRVRRLSDDPEEWQLRPAGASLDFGNPKRWEIQPLYKHSDAAPDMAEALAEYVEWDYANHGGQAASDRILKGRAALQKARGGES